MLCSNDPIIMLLYFLMGFAVANLALCFQHIQEFGMIFDWYHDWLYKYVRYKRLLSKYGKNIRSVSFMAYIAKPLGLCPYCNGIWIAIITYLIAFGFHWDIFLFIGISWFFIRFIQQNKII